jgi:cell division protein FtsZ
MIAYPRSESPSTAVKVRFLGVGNTGVHLDVVALNTDAQSLTSSISPQKVPLGQKATRGLGTGGDPEVGYEAAQESLAEIRSATEGADLIFVCAGLGGGTGSGVAPVLAEAARENGATVFAIVTSPFGFEGKRRTAQAAEALALLSEQCHAVIHFENDRMVELASPRSGIEETFSASDACLIACVTSLLDILHGGSPMPIGLGDLLAAVGGGSPAGLFGRGEASGDNRAHESLERALKSPLLDRGRLLSESHAIIAHISGPPSLSFSEVAAVMREIGKHTAEDSNLFLGVTTRPDPSAPVCVTVFGNYAATGSNRIHVPTPQREFSAPRPVREPEHRPSAHPVPVATVHEKPAEEPKPLFADPTPVEPPVIPVPVAAEKPAPLRHSVRESRPPATAPKPAPAPAAPKVKQETLQFESATRGRFEKSEPTIVEGEDLDVPTFLRMRGKTK